MLVSPVFWSYVVLTNGRKANKLLKALTRQPSARTEETLGRIKVLQIPNQDVPSLVGSPLPVDCPFARLLHLTPALAHLHLRYGSDPNPSGTAQHTLLALAMRDQRLDGLSGLEMSNENFAAALLALEQHAPSLRAISLFYVGSTPPRLLGHLPERFREMLFSRLRYFANGLLINSRSAWHDWFAAGSMLMPATRKAALGIPPGASIDPSLHASQSLFLPVDPGRPSSLFIRQFSDIPTCFQPLDKTDTRELAFRVCLDANHLDDDQIPMDDLKEILDEGTDGVVVNKSVESIILVDGGVPQCPAANRNLAYLVSRVRFSSLKTVVWVSYKKNDELRAWAG